MTSVVREPRFGIETRVVWRRRGDSEWSNGRSINVSQSGLLFRTDQHLDVGVEIEMIIGLSWDTAQDLDLADVMCLARIVRMDGDGALEGEPLLAAQIDSYSFLRVLQQG
jgi:hypothetical protein